MTAHIAVNREPRGKGPRSKAAKRRKRRIADDTATVREARRDR